MLAGRWQSNCRSWVSLPSCHASPPCSCQVPASSTKAHAVPVLKAACDCGTQPVAASTLPAPDCLPATCCALRLLALQSARMSRCAPS